MEQLTNNTVFIVDCYSPYMRNADVRKIFTYNDNLFCIREVPLKWGIPLRESLIDDEDNPNFKLYNTYEEANEYVLELIGAKL